LLGLTSWRSYLFRILEANYILAALLEPDRLLSLNQAQWGQLIRQGKWTGLLARLHAVIEERGLLSEMPDRPSGHLIAARAVADSQERVLRWEVNRIERAFKDAALPFLLLKGAAYVMLELPFARGRVSSDVDILVAKEQLGEAERCLIDWGWAPTKLEVYDQYFYRTYSHELPPLRHGERGTIVDVHHTILPPTGRLHPDPAKLMTAAVEISGTNLRVLAPGDMVLHSAAHAFQDGDLKAGLRDLVDLDGLMRQFGSDPQFWQQLLPRADELQLSRPLYYALRYTKGVLDSPIPGKILEASQKLGPPSLVLKIMDRLVANAVCARPRRGEGFTGGFSAGLLYARSHWLRMSPWPLARHLSRKLFVRKKHL
jgi:hypothetical protein